jgi:uncharacterized membrane protein YbhN (UPF0104 family)
MPVRLRTLIRQLSPLAFATVATMLAALVTVALARIAGFSNVVDVVRDVDWTWIGLAAAGELVAYLGYTFAYRDAVRAGGGPTLSFRRAARLVVAGFGAHRPAGGFAADLRALQFECDDDGDARARVLSLGALEWALLAPAATAAAAYELAEGAHIPLSVTVPWVAAVPLGFAFAVWVSVKIDPARVERLPRLIVRPATSALAALRLLRGLVTTPVHYRGAWAGIGLYWAGDIFCLWAGLQAFGADASIPATVLAYATGYVVSRRSLPLAGAAITEAMLALALTWVGVPIVYALLGVVTYRAFNFLLAMPPGLFVDWRTWARRGVATSDRPLGS